MPPTTRKQKNLDVFSAYDRHTETYILWWLNCHLLSITNMGTERWLFLNSAIPCWMTKIWGVGCQFSLSPCIFYLYSINYSGEKMPPLLGFRWVRYDQEWSPWDIFHDHNLTLPFGRTQILFISKFKVFIGGRWIFSLGLMHPYGTITR